MTVRDLVYSFGARFFEFPFKKLELSREFKLRGMSISHEIQMCVGLLLEATVTWSGTLLVLHVLRMLI